MSDFQKCVDTIKAAHGGDISESQIEQLVSVLQAKQRYLLAKNIVKNDSEAMLRAAQEIGDEAILAATRAKVNAARNLVIRIETVEWIKNQFGKNYAEGLEAYLVGVNRAKQGSRQSVDLVQKTLNSEYMGGFSRDLEHTGLGKIFASGSMDKQVWLALDAINRKNSADLLKGMPKEAIDIARVIDKWQEKSRLDANDAGAWIGKNQSYITHRTHNPEKIRGLGKTEDYVAWKRNAEKFFDLDEMMNRSGAQNADSMLSAIWDDLSTGQHYKDNGDVDPVLAGFKGSANLAKKISQSRTILFKDGNSSFEYNNLYGTSNLREAVMSGLEKRARDVGLLQRLGTNPQNMFDTIRQDLLDSAKVDDKGQVEKLNIARTKLDNRLAQVDGSTQIPGNAMVAQLSANVRAWTTMAKLGGMLASQLGDIASYASGTNYQGRGYLSGMYESITGLGRSLKPQDRRDLAASLGVVYDNIAGELGRMGSFEQPGSMATAMRTFMKWNGSDWWTSRQRTSAVFGMSNYLSSKSSRSWDGLDSDLQRVLLLYDIDAPKWEMIRSTSAKQVDGRNYIIPEAVRDIPDDKFRQYVESIGDPTSEQNMKRLRNELEATVRQFFVGQTSFLALEPDAKTYSIMLQGTKPGTALGEIARHIMQFKSFGFAAIQKIVGRELFGRGYEGNSVIGALGAGNGEAIGIAKLIGTTTLFGYASLALKDIIKGKEPRDPTESPAMARDIMLASMIQGGGFGIYGDFLFGSANRFGNTVLESLAGPNLSTSASVIRLYQQAKDTDSTEDARMAAARSLNLVLQNTPFLNIPYIRKLLDYLIIHQMQESLSPGYLKRLEKDAKKNEQEYLLKVFKPTNTAF